MRKSWIRALVGAGVTAALVALTGTAAMAYPGARDATSVSTDGSRTPQVLVGVGSDTNYEVMVGLDTLYNQSSGCALINDKSKMAVLGGAASTFFDMRCIDGGQLTYSLNYSGLDVAENLYHDVMTEAFPVGSGNGKDILNNLNMGTAGAFPMAGYSRASSTQTFTAAGYTAYGTAFAREGIGFWVSSTNTHVASAASVPKPDLSVAEMHDIWIGNSGSGCLASWSTNATDSTDGTYVAQATRDAGGFTYGANNIVPFAPQSGSGTAKAFDQMLGGTGANPAELQNCIPAAYKAGQPSDHIIFENFAKPICSTTFAAQAIFPYSFGRFTQNKGNAAASGCPGVLGAVNTSSALPGSVTTPGIAPSLIADGLVPPAAGAYPLGRYVYAYVTIPTTVGFSITDPSTWHLLPQKTQAALAYLQPQLGFLCNSGAHNTLTTGNTLPLGTDPFTGVLYTSEIKSTMAKFGFSRLGNATTDTTGTFTGKSYCRYGV